MYVCSGSRRRRAGEMTAGVCMGTGGRRHERERRVDEEVDVDANFDVEVTNCDVYSWVGLFPDVVPEEAGEMTAEHENTALGA